MARIPNKYLKIFARDADNNGVFGSAADNTKILSNDIEVLQSKPAWLTGWLQAVIGTRKYPTLEEFQSVSYVISTETAYQRQEGIPEYNPNVTYYQNSIVKKTGTYEVYGSITNDNTGNPLSDTLNWKFLNDLSLEQSIPYGVTTNSGNNYSVLTDPVFDSLKNGMPILVKINAQNSGASTINPNSINAKPIIMNGSALTGGEMRANTVYLMVYDSTVDSFHLNGGSYTFANNAETQAGVINSKAVTPSGLASLTSTTTRRGLVELATSAETIAGLDTDRAVTPSGLHTVLPFTKSFTSSQVTFTQQSGYSWSHGLGSVPKLIQAELVCVIGQFGFSPGDVVTITEHYQGNGRGFSSWCNSTHVGIGVGVTPVLTGKNGSGTYITYNNWRLRVKAWV